MRYFWEVHDNTHYRDIAHQHIIPIQQAKIIILNTNISLQQILGQPIQCNWTFYLLYCSTAKLCIIKLISNTVCAFQCQPTALLHASGSAQGGQMALSVVYFKITLHWDRPHYVGDEYLYSVLQELVVCVAVCVVQLCREVWDDDERKGEGETRCRLIACSSRKAPRGPARLNVYQQYYMPSQHISAEGFGI